MELSSPPCFKRVDKFPEAANLSLLPRATLTGIDVYISRRIMNQTAGLNPSSELIEALHKFGHKSFRAHQEEVCEAVLQGRDALAFFPTGHGKSLLYQLPAEVFRKRGEGMTLVVSPLIALMHDQVQKLNERGIGAVSLDSSLSDSEIGRAIKAVQNEEVSLVFVSPERLISNKFLSELKKGRFKLFAVDEAHCLSEWGHDFRPSYLQMLRAREALSIPQTLALTATATREVIADIKEYLSLADGSVFSAPVWRENLTFDRVRVGSESLKEEHLFETVKERLQNDGVILVYCSRIREVQRLAAVAGEMSLPAEIYHGKMDAEERKSVLKKFKENMAPLIFCTSAFGMGIDHDNIHTVLHYEVPGSLSAYYQAAGRAGRGGGEALCRIFYAPVDISTQEFFLKCGNPSLRFLQSIYEMLQKPVFGAGRGEEFQKRFFDKREFCNFLNRRGNPLWDGHFSTALGLFHRFDILIESDYELIFPRPVAETLESFPITQEYLDRKKARDESRLGEVLEYVLSDEDPRIFFERAFSLDGDINKEVSVGSLTGGTLPSSGMTVLTPEIEEGILRTVAERDLSPGMLVQFLLGTRKPSSETESPYIGKFSQYTSRELRRACSELKEAGLVAQFSVGRSSSLTLSEAGLKRLQSEGVLTEPPQSFQDLKGRLLSAYALPYVRDALNDWFEREKAKRPESWYQVCRELLFYKGEKEVCFTILDKELSARQVLGEFRRSRVPKKPNWNQQGAIAAQFRDMVGLAMGESLD